MTSCSTVGRDVDARLQDIVRFAATECDFYQSLYESSGVDILSVRTVHDLWRLPMVSSADLIHAGIRARRARPYRISASSGSTDEAKTLFRTAEDSATSLKVVLRLCGMADLRSGDRLLIGQPFDLAHIGYLWVDACRELGMLAIPIGLGVSDAHVMRVIERYQPNAIFTSPSRLATISGLVRTGAVGNLRLEKILLAGEPATAEQLRQIHEAWRVAPVNIYGSEETDGLAGSCELRTGLHFMNDLFVLELIDTHTGLQTNTGFGEAVITSLYSVGTPLIRYRLGDLVRILEPCRCGRPWPLIEVLGRTADVLYLYDGIKLHWWQVDEVLRKQIPTLVRVQLVCSSLDGREQVDVVIEAPGELDVDALTEAIWTASLDLHAARDIGNLTFRVLHGEQYFRATARGKTPRVLDLRPRNSADAG